jgi:hypothetical protein
LIFGDINIVKAQVIEVERGGEVWKEGWAYDIVTSHARDWDASNVCDTNSLPKFWPKEEPNSNKSIELLETEQEKKWRVVSECWTVPFFHRLNQEDPGLRMLSFEKGECPQSLE